MLEKLKVVELASVLAGPLVGTFFAELGAQVIKVENAKTGGDVTRSWKLSSEKAEAPFSAYYCAANWGKESLQLDLTDPEERTKLYALITDADIIITNYKAGDAEKLKVSYEYLKKRNPNIIHANINGFGEENERVAYDMVLQAESGFMYMNGAPNGQAVKMPVALVDVLAAHQLKEAILLALLKREKEKCGSYIEVSLFDTAVASLANQATNYLMAGHIPEKMGSLHPNIAPYGEQFTTKDDKQIVLAVGTDTQFERLCDVLNLTALKADACFQSNQLRVKNRKALHQVLEEAIKNRGREELIGVFIKNKVPAGAIRNMKEVFELPEAQQLIQIEELTGGFQSKSVKTITFKIM